MRDGWRMLMEKESLWYKVLVGLNREEGEERKLCKKRNGSLWRQHICVEVDFHGIIGKQNKMECISNKGECK